MKAGERLKDVDDIEVIEKRFELMTLAKYRNKDRISKASQSIDEIRKKVGKRGESMTKTVREWREERYGPFWFLTPPLF